MSREIQPMLLHSTDRTPSCLCPLLYRAHRPSSCTSFRSPDGLVVSISESGDRDRDNHRLWYQPVAASLRVYSTGYGASAPAWRLHPSESLLEFGPAAGRGSDLDKSTFSRRSGVGTDVDLKPARAQGGHVQKEGAGHPYIDFCHGLPEL
jgi:hypothetical protein